ncbi:hypothetical protein IMZ48_16245 [Candidatus Bathyarchaeota archaeon]|nr:hypothetical protein [Candidatus Bathyarchaeota archaeon]
MKATLALTLANAMLVAAGPLQERAYVTEVDIKTVTAYVYPDGSPATHLGAQPTGDAAYSSTVAKPSTDAPSSKPSTPKPSPEEEKPATEEPAEPSTGEQEAPATGGGAGAENGADVGSVQEASMNAHNAHRGNHTCGQVEWDSELAAYAQELADTCEYKHNMYVPSTLDFRVRKTC